MNGSRLRVIGLADTDSYVKWAAALLGSRPDALEVELIIVETPVVVSRGQQDAALTGSGLDPGRVRRMTFSDLAEYLCAAAPDAVLVAARGPLVRVLARLVASLPRRPVIVTGLPGISVPATSAALIHRTQCDLFILHSTREIREFTALAAQRGIPHRFGLAHLPFADAARGPGSGTDLVFAAQAIVPRARHDRQAVARLLIAAAEADPGRRVIVKLRAVRGEKQTHHEHDGYAELLARIGNLPSNLVVSTAPMASALDHAEGLVTISSTAAIEAVARGIPAIALDTFGVSDDLINPVFRGSGMLAGDAAVMARRFRHPRAEWLRDNYFHERDADDWFEALSGLVHRRQRGELAPKAPRIRRGGRLRDAWERKIALGRHDRSLAGMVTLVVGVPLRAALRGYRGAQLALGLDGRRRPSANERADPLSLTAHPYGAQRHHDDADSLADSAAEAR